MIRRHPIRPSEMLDFLDRTRLTHRGDPAVRQRRR